MSAQEYTPEEIQAMGRWKLDEDMNAYRSAIDSAARYKEQQLKRGQALNDAEAERQRLSDREKHAMERGWPSEKHWKLAWFAIAGSGALCMVLMLVLAKVTEQSGMAHMGIVSGFIALLSMTFYTLGYPHVGMESDTPPNGLTRALEHCIITPLHALKTASLYHVIKETHS